MTDDEVIRRAADLCDRGRPAPCQEQIAAPRLRRIVDVDDWLEACYMVPALLELIERRGLGDATDA